MPRTATSGPEDDGWILFYSYDSDRDASGLVVLDAHDFTGHPAAVVPLRVRVPFGCHSTWIPQGSHAATR